MSYGCAGRRDERRQGALLRITADVVRYKEAVAKKKELSENDRKYLRLKTERAEVVLKNTQANLGKGTCAMQKRESKRVAAVSSN